MMQRILNTLRSSGFWILLAALLYFAGLAFIKPIVIEGDAHQEEYTYTDSEGEEHEGLTLINIKGIGDVLTYKDIYLSFLAVILPVIIFAEVADKKDVVYFIVLAGGVLGCLLIRLMSKGDITPTILFWLSLFALYHSKGLAGRDHTKEDKPFSYKLHLNK